MGEFCVAQTKFFKADGVVPFEPRWAGSAMVGRSREDCPMTEKYQRGPQCLFETILARESHRCVGSARCV